MANVIVLTGASEKADGDLPRILYDNALKDASIVASSTDSSSNVAYLTDDRLDRAWIPVAGTSHTITATFSTAQAVTAFGVHGHNIGTLSGSVAVDVQIEGSGTWTAAVAATALTGSRTFYRAITELTVDAIRYTVTTPTSAQPAIAALFGGLDFECERGLQPGWADPLLGRSPNTRPAVARTGVPLPATIIDATLRQTFSLNDCSQSWAWDTWFPFMRATDGSALPFLLSWGPATYPDRACYCSGATFESPSFASKGFVDCSFDARMDAETGWVQ